MDFACFYASGSLCGTLSRCRPEYTIDMQEADMRSFFKLLPELMDLQGHSVEPRSLPIQLGEEQDGLFLRALVPGVPKDKLNIELQGQTISISGRITPERGLYHRQERPAGYFCRSIDLGCPIRASEVEANLDDGVLTLRLPKQTPGKACHPKRRIVCGAGR